MDGGRPTLANRDGFIKIEYRKIVLPCPRVRDKHWGVDCDYASAKYRIVKFKDWDGYLTGNMISHELGWVDK